MMMMMMMMMMADQEWARVYDLNLVLVSAQRLTLILLQAELCCVGLVRFSLFCVGHPLFIMTTQQVKPTGSADWGRTRGLGRGKSHCTCWSSILDQEV